MKLKLLQILALSSLLSSILPGGAFADAGAANQLGGTNSFADAADIDASYGEAVKSAYDLQLMNGYANNLFKPHALLSRQEIAVTIARALQLKADGPAISYLDVMSSSWSRDAIEAVVQAGIMLGDGKGSFQPAASISREEAAVLLVRASKEPLVEPNESGDEPSSDWGKVSEWAKPYVRTAIVKGFMSLNNRTFDPHAGVQRQEMADLLMRTFFPGTSRMSSLRTFEGRKAELNGIRLDIAPQAENILNADNADILKKAALSYVADKRAIKQIQNLTLTASGREPDAEQAEFSDNLVLDGQGGTIAGNLIVRGDYATVRNLTVEGDLVIEKSLLHDFKAANVTVRGKTIVRGGDSNTVVFEDADLGEVDINKQDVHVETSGKTTVAQMNVESAGEVTLEGKIGTLTVTSQQPVTLSGGASISTLSVQGEGTVALNTTGSIERLEVTNPDAHVTVSNPSSLGGTDLGSGVPSSAVTYPVAPASAARSIVNTAPYVVNPLPSQMLQLGADSMIDIGSVFKDDQQSTLKLTALSANSTTVQVSVSGTSLKLTPLKVGSNINIVLTADDQNGKKTNFIFKVSVNRAPAATLLAADAFVETTKELVVDLDTWFEDADGDKPTYEAQVNDSAVASATVTEHTLVLKGLSTGTTAVTLHADDGRGGSLEKTIDLTVDNRPVASPIEDRIIAPNAAPAELHPADYFTDDDADVLTFTAESDNPLIAAVSISPEGVLSITPGLHGQATITVTAADGRGGSVSAGFFVTVNNKPVAGAATADRTLTENGDPATVDLSTLFDDPDNDELTYTAVSGDPSIAETAVTGGTLTITPKTRGTTSLTVTASDGTDSSDPRLFTVTVNGQPAAGAGFSAAETLQLGASPTDIDLSDKFSDPDGDTLTFDLVLQTDDEKAVVEASLTNGVLSLTPISAGKADVKLTVSDGRGGSLEKTIAVTVNTAPNSLDTLADDAFQEGDAAKPYGLSGAFADADEDTLTFDATSSDTSVATATAVGNTLTVTPTGHGTATITVTAHDGRGGTGEASFTVTVNGQPAAGAGFSAAETLQLGASPTDIDLSDKFSDPDGDTLTFDLVLQTDDEKAVVEASLTNGVLSLTPISAGKADVKLTVSDGQGGSLEKTIIVTVNTAPYSLDTLANDTIQEDDPAKPYGLSGAFADADEDTLTFDATSSNTSVATATAVGNTLTVTPTGRGTATITVTAHDGRGGTGETSFEVAVNGQPKAAAGQPAPQSINLPVGDVIVDLSTVFADADGDALTFDAESQDASIVTASVAGLQLTLTPVAIGETTVTLMAEDGNGGQASATLAVTVINKQNEKPAVVASVSKQVLTPTITNDRSYDISQLFEDPEGDTMTFSAVSNNIALVSAAMEDALLTISASPGAEAGSTTITVTAMDSHGLTNSFDIDVRIAPLMPDGYVVIPAPAAPDYPTYELSTIFPGETSFVTYMGTADSTFVGPTTLNGTLWTGDSLATVMYTWIIGADGKAVVIRVTIGP